MSTRPETISIPSFAEGKEGDPRKVPYEELLEAYTTQLEQLPRFIRSLHETDAEGWNQLLQEVGQGAERNPELANLFRVEEENGQEVLKIGDLTVPVPQDAEGPERIIPLIIAAYVGWEIGSACFDSGYCDFFRSA